MAQSRKGLLLSRLVILALVAGVGEPAWARIIRVPAQESTIQSAIDSAQDGDIVEVGPGTYFEKLNFHRKAIVVTSRDGPAVTTIDGSGQGSVVTFSSGESPASRISGFTITDGNAEYTRTQEGGGIDVENSSPTIRGDIITNNGACGGGGGIAVHSGSPVIESNTITNNGQDGCSGGGGGGIGLAGAGSAQILSNIISGNSWGTDGGGISVTYGAMPLIMDNLISGNMAGCCNQGGGIYAVSGLVVQNVIVGNQAGQGGGVYLEGGPLLVNNTIAGNQSREGGSAIYASAYSGGSTIINNLLIGSGGQTAIGCDLFGGLQYNDVFSANGTAYGPNCGDETGQEGNISTDPMFADAATDNYELLAGSPAIGAGTTSAPDLPSADFYGNPRPEGGQVDMGAIEFQSTPGATPTATPTPSVSGGRLSISGLDSSALIDLGSVGTDTRAMTRTLRITNTGAGMLAGSVDASDLVSPFAVSSPGISQFKLARGQTRALTIHFSPSTPQVYHAEPYLGVVRIASSDPRDRTALVAAFGIGVTGLLEVEPSKVLNFGKVALGLTKTLHLTLTNVGPGVLHASLAFGNDCFVLSPATASQVTLAPRESKRVGVQFTPGAASQCGDVLEIQSDDGRNPFQILVKGVGTPAF